MKNEGKRMYWWAGCKGCGAFQVTSALAFLVDLLDRSPRAVGNDKGFWTWQHPIIASEICQKSTFWNWDSGCLVELHRIQHLRNVPMSRTDFLSTKANLLISFEGWPAKLSQSPAVMAMKAWHPLVSVSER